MKKSLTTLFLQPSQDPDGDMALVAYPGQHLKMRGYHHGYEYSMAEMPIITPSSPFRSDMVRMSKETLNKLAKELSTAEWVKDKEPGEKDFARTVLALESPQVGKAGIKEGSEILIAHWGKGFQSPVHGHAAGYMHEEIIYGKILVNTYRIVRDNIVRLIKTEIVGPGTFVSEFAEQKPDAKFKRQTLIHNFKAIEASASLHYVPEHTRDGRDNGFMVEYFDQHLCFEDVTRIDSKQGMYLQKGEVVLVRSTNVPEYGDHFIVITGAPTLKEHGLRPQDVAISAPKNTLLDKFPLQTGLTLLKLNKQAQERFLTFHGIEIVNGEVVFPQP